LISLAVAMQLFGGPFLLFVFAFVTSYSLANPHRILFFPLLSHYHPPFVLAPPVIVCVDYGTWQEKRLRRSRIPRSLLGHWQFIRRCIVLLVVCLLFPHLCFFFFIPLFCLLIDLLHIRIHTVSNRFSYLSLR
jgi:hypothetical protein